MRKNFSGSKLQSMDPEHPTAQIARAIVKERRAQHITQQELALKTGIAQADISRIENANANPSLKTLQRLVDGLGMKMRLTIIDKSVPINPEAEENSVEDAAVAAEDAEFTTDEREEHLVAED